MKRVCPYCGNFRESKIISYYFPLIQRSGSGMVADIQLCNHCTPRIPYFLALKQGDPALNNLIVMDKAQNKLYLLKGIFDDIELQTQMITDPSTKELDTMVSPKQLAIFTNSEKGSDEKHLLVPTKFSFFSSWDDYLHTCTVVVTLPDKLMQILEQKTIHTVTEEAVAAIDEELRGEFVAWINK